MCIYIYNKKYISPNLILLLYVHKHLSSQMLINKKNLKAIVSSIKANVI